MFNVMNTLTYFVEINMDIECMYIDKCILKVD